MSNGGNNADFTQDVDGNNCEDNFVTSDATGAADNPNNLGAEGDAQEASTENETKPDAAAASESNENYTKEETGSEDRKLFVGGLSWETRDPHMKEYFEKFGELESVNVKLDPVSGKSRCFAFVVYKKAEDVKKCLDAGEHCVNSKKVDVKKARAKPGKIFIGGLKPAMTDDQIREHFEQYGPIIEFDMPFDKVKNQRKGFGFITFEREETMKEVLKKQRVTIGEFEVDLRKATPRSEMNSFRGGFGGMQGSYGSMGVTDYYSGYNDYYGGYGAANYSDYYGNWGGYSNYGMGATGGGKMRGGGATKGAAKKTGTPY